MASGCYALTNIYDDVIYIGQSKHLSERMDQHLKDPRITQVTKLGLANWFAFWLRDEATLKSEEDQLLFRFKLSEGQLPELNRLGP